MFLLRWIPTFLAFPLAGLLTMTVVGPNRNALTALAAGAIVGAVIGGAQWLALGRLGGWRWAVATLTAVAVGSTISILVVGSPVTPVAALVTGLITGVAVGAAQAPLLRRGWVVGMIWTATVGASWAMGWLITSAVIVDLDRGHAVFGATGALVATVVTGVVLRIILAPRLPRRRRDASETTPVMDVAASVIAATDSATRRDV